MLRLLSAHRLVTGRSGTRGKAQEPSTETPPCGASCESLRNWVAIIIGIVIAYQIATLGAQGLWYDEIFTVMVTQPKFSLVETFQKYLLRETNPPLHFVLIHFWQLIAPRGDWVMRVPGLFCYVLTIAAAALYPCEAMNTARRIAFIALVGCSYGTIYFAQEVRPYYVFGLLAICILYDMLDYASILSDGRVPPWTRLGWSALVGLLVSYNHYYGFLFFGTTILALLGYSIARGRVAWRIVALGSAVALGFLPWVFVQLRFIAGDLGGHFWLVNRPVGVLRGFLRHLVGSPFAAALIAILASWALFLHSRALLASRALWLTLAVIALNISVLTIMSLYTPILNERYLTGVRVATLLALALIIAESLPDWLAQAVLIATAGTLFVSFIATQAPKASWREPADYVIEHTRCDRREILFYTRTGIRAWTLSYYLPNDRFRMRESNFDSGVVRELSQLNETRPGCDVVAIALNIDPKIPEDWEVALADTPFRGPSFHLEQWPSAFVVRRISP
jgi:hypothetical protein